MGSIPVDDDRGEQVEPGHVIVQSLGVDFRELISLL